MAIKRIKFVREGGVTGIPLTYEVDTESLSPEEVATLQELVDKAGFFNLPPTIAASTEGADRFQFTLKVDVDDKSHSVRTADPVPQSLEKLIEFLTKLARAARAGGSPHQR